METQWFTAVAVIQKTTSLPESGHRPVLIILLGHSDLPESGKPLFLFPDLTGIHQNKEELLGLLQGRVPNEELAEIDKSFRERAFAVFPIDLNTESASDLLGHRVSFEPGLAVPSKEYSLRVQLTHR